MTRSSHIAIKLPAERIEAAVAHYKAVLGLTEVSRTEDGVELKGPNFTLWIDRSTHDSVVFQEFVAKEGRASRALHLAHGCVPFSESEHGFHIRDEFGLNYHVWTGDEDPG